MNITMNKKIIILRKYPYFSREKKKKIDKYQSFDSQAKNVSEYPMRMFM